MLHRRTFPTSMKPALSRTRKVTRCGEILGEAATPRVVWSYWDKGVESLSDFRQLCVSTWRAMNPAWEVIILNPISMWDFVDVNDLPRRWSDMYVAFQADALRLALLCRYGGMWVDVATICLRTFDSIMYDVVRDEGHPADVGAFYFSSWGVEMGVGSEYVENWLLAARREHPLMLRWKELFCQYWDSVSVNTMELYNLPDHDMFKHIDLSHMQRFGHDMRPYLVMHSCFKKMIDEEPEMREIWARKMVLIRADEHGLWQCDEAGVCWDVLKGLRRWFEGTDDEWVKCAIKNCYVMKFTKQFAVALDKLPKGMLWASSGFPRCSFAELVCSAFVYEAIN